MAMLPLRLPTIQNWSCHNCSGCCRKHLIEITEVERQRILKQNWKPKDGIPEWQPVIETSGGSPWNRRYRLAHTEDGSCVFLNEDGLCRIHAKFGEPAKPLACRIYPYAFHPAGKKVTVSLRFSCPSVVSNLGKSALENRDEIKSIGRLVVPDGAEQIPPPPVAPGQKVGWEDILRFAEAFGEILAETDAPLIERIFRILYVLSVIDESRFRLIRGEQLSEFLSIISEAADDEVLPEKLRPASGIGQVQFRLLVAQYARKDTVADLGGGLGDKWNLLKAALRFTTGHGEATALQGCFKDVPFSEIEKPFGPVPKEAEEIFTRYLRVKIQGLHFCGRAYYDVPFVEGLRSLLLIVPAILWLARWLAASDSRKSLKVNDIKKAMTIADHHHGYSPALGTRSFRRRVRLLAQTGDLQNLILWYLSDQRTS